MSGNTGSSVAGWWRGLQPSHEAGKERRGDRGALARLRRCGTIMEAASETATIALCRNLHCGESGLDRAALIAAVLAHVREDAHGQSVARQIGVQKDGTAAMSDLRFRRLLEAETSDERLIAFRRLVAFGGYKLNVSDLASSLWNWNDATRRRWIYAYHDAPDSKIPATPAPHATEDASA